MFREAATSVARNTSVMLFQHVITTASSILLLIFVPRYLGPAEYGRLYLATAITAMFQIVVNFGNSYLIAKHIAREPEQTGQILVDALLLRTALATVSLAAMAAIGFLGGYPEEVRLLLLINGAGLYVYVAYTSLYACFQGHEALRYTSAGAIIEKLSVSAVAIAGLVLGKGTVFLLLVLIGGSILDVIVLAVMARRIVPSLPRVRWRSALAQMKEGVPYFLFAIFGVIYYKIDSVMLSKMSSEEVVGWYGGAYRLFETLNFPYLLTMAAYPVLSRLWKEEAHSHRRTTQKSLEIVLLLGIPVTIGGIALARPIINMFFGLSGYEPAVFLFQLLMAGILFLYADMILGTTLLSVDRQRPLMILSLSAIPFNVGLNFVLIPLFEHPGSNGAVGAAIATGITEVAIMIAVLRMLPAGTLAGFRWATVGKGAGAGAGMTLALVACQAVRLPWPVAGLAATAVYGGLLFALRVFEPAELRFLRGLLRWKEVRTMVAGRAPDGAIVNE